MLRHFAGNGPGNMAVSRPANIVRVAGRGDRRGRGGVEGQTLLDADAALAVTRSLPHGHVALVAAQAARLGLPPLLGPACRERDLAYALIVSRVVRPRPKSATRLWWEDVMPAGDLGVADAGRDEVYASMDWLLTRQDVIEAELARRHLRGNDQRGVARRDVRLVLVVGGGQLLPAGRARLLPRRAQGQAAHRVRAAVRSGGAPGRDPGVLR